MHSYVFVLISCNVRSTTPDNVIEVSKLDCIDIVEINCHCRQKELTDIGCGQNMLIRSDLEDYICEVVDRADSKVSVKIRANVDGVDTLSIAKLIDEYIRLTDSGYKVGCIGPVFFNRSTGKIAIPKIKKEISKNSFAVKTIITSSMVTTYGVLKQVGFWNEKLFLDLADWDLCLRMENKNYLCVESKVSILTHAVGNGFRQVLFYKLNVQSNLVREFYQTRNCLYLLTKKYVPLRYKLRFLLTITVRPVLHLLFLEHGVSRMKYVIRGYQSFFARDTGEYRLSK